MSELGYFVICSFVYGICIHIFFTAVDDEEQRTLIQALQAHGAAAFLPWHRYFIHIYEQTLRARCGYDGLLPYVCFRCAPACTDREDS